MAFTSRKGLPPVVTDLQERKKGTEAETTCEKVKQCEPYGFRMIFSRWKALCLIQTSARKSESFWEGEDCFDVLEIHVRGERERDESFVRQHTSRKWIKINISLIKISKVLRNVTESSSMAVESH